MRIKNYKKLQNPTEGAYMVSPYKHKKACLLSGEVVCRPAQVSRRSECPKNLLPASQSPGREGIAGPAQLPFVTLSLLRPWSPLSLGHGKLAYGFCLGSQPQRGHVTEGGGRCQLWGPGPRMTRQRSVLSLLQGQGRYVVLLEHKALGRAILDKAPGSSRSTTCPRGSLSAHTEPPEGGAAHA